MHSATPEYSASVSATQTSASATPAGLKRVVAAGLTRETRGKSLRYVDAESAARIAARK